MFQDVLLIGLVQVFSTYTNTSHTNFYYCPAVAKLKRRIKRKAILPFHFVCHNFRLNSIRFSHNGLIAHRPSDPNWKTLIFIRNILFITYQYLILNQALKSTWHRRPVMPGAGIADEIVVGVTNGESEAWLVQAKPNNAQPTTTCIQTTTDRF